jgi:hypothetical protein
MDFIFFGVGSDSIALITDRRNLLPHPGDKDFYIDHIVT